MAVGATLLVLPTQSGATEVTKESVPADAPPMEVGARGAPPEAEGPGGDMSADYKQMLSDSAAWAARQKPLARIACRTSMAEAAHVTLKIALARTPSGGQEMTEYYEGGAYRLSRCTQSGDFEFGMEVSPVTALDGTRHMVPSAWSVPDGKLIKTISVIAGRYANNRVTRRYYRRFFRRHRPPSRHPYKIVRGRAHGQAHASHISGGKCQQPPIAFTRSGQTGWARWPARGYTYYFNYNSFGAGQNWFASQNQWGHWAWAYVYSTCRSPQYLSRPAFTIVFDGWTEYSAGNQDGWNVVSTRASGWCGVGTAACQASWGTWDNTMWESDTIFMGNNVTLPNGRVVIWSDYAGCPPGGQYDCYNFRAVSVHETGHSLSLGHVPNANNHQAMDGNAATTDLDLGSGDVNGMWVLYPW